MCRQAEALDCFGQIFRFTLGANSDLGKASQLLNKAAETAHFRAMCHYEDLVQECRSVPQAIRYLRPARGYVFDRNTAHRVPEATYALCELLQYGDERVKPGLEREVTWTKQSAEQGQSLQFDQSLHRPSDFSWFSHSRQYQL
jgi:TPR repeat protein